MRSSQSHKAHQSDTTRPPRASIRSRSVGGTSRSLPSSDELWSSSLIQTGFAIREQKEVALLLDRRLLGARLGDLIAHALFAPLLSTTCGLSFFNTIVVPDTLSAAEFRKNVNFSFLTPEECQLLCRAPLATGCARPSSFASTAS